VGKPAVFPMVEDVKGESVGNWKLMVKCLDLDLKGSHKWVLVVLCYHYPNIFPSEARIAKEAGIGLTAAKGAIKYLESEGWITRERRYSKSTVYTVNVARIMATPPRRLRIPAVEGGLPFPRPEADGTSQPPESAGFRPSEPPQTAGIRPIDSRNPATNRQDNKQVLTDNRDKPEKASRQKYTKDIESTNHASKELENEPQELNAGMEIESNDLTSRGDLTVDAQSALGPNCALSRPEVGGVEDHMNRADLRIPVDDTHACQQELETITSPLPAGLSDVSNTTASRGDWVDDGIIADDPGEDAEDNTIETRECAKSKLTLPAYEFPAQEAGQPAELSPWRKTSLPAHLSGEADLGHGPKSAVAIAQQAIPGPVSSEPDQRRQAPAPKPEAKPKCNYAIQEGPECWFIVDVNKDCKTVARAATMEQASLISLQMNGRPHDRFLASKSDGVCKVFDTAGGVVAIVKTCATIEEAREEAARLSKESQQPRSLKPAA